MQFWQRESNGGRNRSQILLHPTENAKNVDFHAALLDHVEELRRCWVFFAGFWVNKSDHDEGVFCLSVYGVVERQEGVAKEIVLLVEVNGRLVGAENVKVATFDVWVDFVVAEVVEKCLEEKGADSVATKPMLNA